MKDRHDPELSKPREERTRGNSLIDWLYGILCEWLVTRFADMATVCSKSRRGARRSLKAPTPGVPNPRPLAPELIELPHTCRLYSSDGA